MKLKKEQQLCVHHIQYIIAATTIIIITSVRVSVDSGCLVCVFRGGTLTHLLGICQSVGGLWYVCEGRGE